MVVRICSHTTCQWNSLNWAAYPASPLVVASPHEMEGATRLRPEHSILLPARMCSVRSALPASPSTRSQARSSPSSVASARMGLDRESSADLDSLLARLDLTSPSVTSLLPGTPNAALSSPEFFTPDSQPGAQGIAMPCLALGSSAQAQARAPLRHCSLKNHRGTLHTPDENVP